MVNIRNKGQHGEREIQSILNDAYLKFILANELEFPFPNDYPFQRNQNQTAVGGSDLSNPFKLAIEVKRQEQLAINTWWKQCVLSAQRTNEIPILIFKQSRKPWRVIMWLSITDQFDGHVVRGEIGLDDFVEWFQGYLQNKYECGEIDV